MRIRLAKASDLAAIVACEDLAFNPFASGANGRNVSPDGDLSCQIRDGAIYVISDSARVMGYISVSGNFDHLFVGAIAVLPGHHRKGLGSQLLAFAEHEALRLGLQSVTLFTDGNITGNLVFYRRNGYQETDRCDGNGFSRVFFKKAVVPRLSRPDEHGSVI